MTRRVLVTRPEPGASATAEALRAAGFEPVIGSLTEIVALPVGEIDIGDAIAVAATSANAIRHAPKLLLARLAGLPLFAVGEATAEAAKSAGFATVVTGPGDAAGLVALALGRLPAGSTVVYLCGKVRRPDFETLLASGGVRTSAVETYDTRAGDLKSAFEPATMSGAPLLAVLVHSAEAAKALSGVVSQPGAERMFAGALVVAISDRTAAPVRDIFPGRLRVAVEPTDAAMIASLSAAI